MIKEIRYKGQVVNLNDIEITWTDHFGDVQSGNIEDYAWSSRNDAISEFSAGEGW